MLRQQQLAHSSFQFVIKYSVLLSWSYKYHFNIIASPPLPPKKINVFFSLFRCHWWEVKRSNKDKSIIVSLRKCNLSSGGWEVQTHSLQGFQIDKASTGKTICFSVVIASGKPWLILGENNVSALFVPRFWCFLTDLLFSTKGEVKNGNPCNVQTYFQNYTVWKYRIWTSFSLYYSQPMNRDSANLQE